VAVDEFGAAAALEPRNATYVHAYAVALVRHGRLADGLAEMDSVVRLDPRNTGIRMEAAGLYLRSGNAAEALKHLDVYVATAPRDPVGLVSRARALVELDRVDDAERNLDRARELIAAGATSADLDEALQLATGRIHEIRGETTAAIRAYEAALAANPVSDEARRRIRALSFPVSE
jgi:tetratricopeptide (TPR) repeat protein